MKKHKKTFAKPKRHGLLRSFAIVLALLIALPALGLSVWVSTFDINAYRDEMALALSKKVGREIKLNGDIGWSASLDHGLSVSIKDVSIGNPSWAGRQRMAQIEKAKLHVALIPLLDRRLDVIAFEVNGVDAQLETSQTGATNWRFEPQTTVPSGNEADKTTVKQSPLTFNIRSIAVSKARIGIKGKDGSLSLYDIPSLTLTSSPKGTRIHFTGTLAGVPASIDVTGGSLESLMGKHWPFNLQLIIGRIAFDARGALHDSLQKITLDEYLLENGKSQAKGSLFITLDKARPQITGSIASKYLDPADFQLEAASSSPSSKGDEAPPQKQRLFSDAPLGLEKLRTVDLALDVAIDEMIVGLTSLAKVTTKVDLNAGRLSLAPITGTVAKSNVDGNLKIDASSGRPQLTAALRAPEMDLSQLVKLGGMESAITGKSDFSLNLQSSGNTLHEMASYANGNMALYMNSGTISSNELKGIASSLIDLFAPGIGSLTKSGLNCIASRYTITNGLLETKGLLIDTAMTTIAGTGYVNLADERINMSLRTKPKAVSLGGMMPPMIILGPLNAPSFTMDAGAAVQKVTGLLLGDKIANDGVPTVINAPGNVNACAYTLDHPAAAAAATDAQPTKTLTPGSMDEITDTVKDLGDSMLKGLKNGILGQ